MVEVTIEAEGEAGEDIEEMMAEVNQEVRCHQRRTMGSVAYLDCL